MKTREIMSGKKLWIRALGIFVVLSFVVSCSKQLMPPEIESMGSVAESELEEVAEGSDATQGFAPEQDFSSDGAGSEESGFVREENLTESGAVDGAPIISREDGAYNPFAKDGTGSGLDQGIQEARLYSFRPTSELKDIHFQFDKYDLDSSSKGVLKQNADFLKQHPSVKVEIQGHCDERGTNNYNLALGQRRAASTKSYLASLGIPENRLHVISYGEEKPFCGETNEGCWGQNRRAHFMVAE
jgi:peptidoglycan-associated lipoprotein